MMHPNRNKQRQLKQSALCRAVESNRLNENYQKDLDQIERNSLEQWRKKTAGQESRCQKHELEQIALNIEAEKQQRLIDEETRKLMEATRQRINEEKLRQQIRESSQEMREMESKLRAAYVSKGIAMQLHEAQMRKNEERLLSIKEMEEHDKLKQENIKQMKEKQISDDNEKRLLRTVLQEQMNEARYIKRCLYQEFLIEKNHLDAVCKKIQEEHLEAIQQKLELQKRTQQEMEYFQEAKKTWKARQELLAEKENERIRAYVQEQDRLKELERQNKEEMKSKRETINEAMVAKLEQETNEQRNREEMLQDLYIAERDEKEKILRQQELEEQIRKRIKTRLDYERQLIEKNCQRELQAEEDKRFQEHQIKTWAERDRIDMMSNEKRRRKMTEYRRAVQELLEDRRKRRMEDVKNVMEDEERQRQEERRKQEILEEERIKLLLAHANALMGFFPVSILQERDREFIPLPKPNKPK